MTALRHLAAALLLGGIGIAGCGTKAVPADDAPETPKADVPVAKAVAADPEPPKKAVPPAVKRDRLHQAFADATRDGSDSPEGAACPPDCLKSGTPCVAVLEAVKASWDTIRFTTPAGKPIRYEAQIATSVGLVKMKLLPEQAPNHCRNFIALARAGYFDGLCFERLRSEVAEGGKFESVEAGCPVGRGDPDTGSIGYWLKDELTSPMSMSHEEGVVGACRSAEKDSAACRFYITLTKSAFLDGNYTLFGKVTTGLDAARKIFGGEVLSEDMGREGARRPAKPVTIMKVTVTQTEG